MAATPRASHNRRLTQCANLAVESAFVTSCLVFVDQAFAGHVIQYRRCLFQGSFSSAFIPSSDRCEYALYHRTHHGALARITLTGFFSLTHAFARLSSVGHELSSSLSVQNSAAHYPPGATPRQRLVS